MSEMRLSLSDRAVEELLRQLLDARLQIRAQQARIRRLELTLEAHRDGAE